MVILAATSPTHPQHASALRIARSRTLGWVCAAAASLCTSLVAAAPDDTPAPTTETAVPTADAKKKAAEHFETGLRLYEDSEFALALIEFERAYSYVQDYRVLFNIGQVSVQLARYARAVNALKQYLQVGGASIAPARINSVREDLKILEGRTAHLQIECNVEGAEILLDDVPIGHTPIAEPLLVDAGEHRLTIQKPGYLTKTERLVLAGRDENKQVFALAEVPKAVTLPTHPGPIAQPLPKTEPPPPPKPMSTRTQLLYAGAGATGLFAVAWAVTGYVGIKAAGDLHDALQRPTSQGELDSYKSKARGALIASDILGVATLVAGGTTLYFTLKGPSKEQPKAKTSRIDVRVAPSAVLVTGTF
jgi:hypothetical protein